MRLNAFLALGEHLARAPERGPIEPRTLQARFDLPRVGVSTATFYNWLSHLEFQRAISRDPDGLRVDRRRLLDFYAAHRVVRARPLVSTTTSLSGDELTGFLEDHGVRDIALGFLSAANAWAFFEPRRATELYASRATARRLRHILPEGRRPLHVFEEHWAELPTVRRGAPATSLFLTIVDCLAHPEGGAHAAFLQRELLWGGP